MSSLPNRMRVFALFIIPDCFGMWSSLSRLKQLYSIYTICQTGYFVPCADTHS